MGLHHPATDTYLDHKSFEENQESVLRNFYALKLNKLTLANKISGNSLDKISGTYLLSYRIIYSPFYHN